MVAGRVAVEPARDVVEEELLAPQHPGERLAHDLRLVRRCRRRRQLRVERVGLLPACRDDPVEVRPRGGRAAGRTQAEPQLDGRARLDRDLVPERCLRAAPLGVHGSAPDTTWSLMPSLGYAGEVPTRRGDPGSCRCRRRGAPAGCRPDPRPRPAPGSRGTGARWRPCLRGARSSGRGASTSQLHVLRYQAVGRTCSVSASGPALVTRTTISRSNGSALTWSTSTIQ